MKQSRKIRRSWLRVIPEWMKCFVMFKAESKKLKAEITRKIRTSVSSLKSAISSQLSALAGGVRAHTKEWVAAALAAGLIVAPYAANPSPDFQLSAFSSQLCLAAPAGGEVVGGQATIQQQAETTNVTQSSQRAAIDWSSFDIAKNETVNFLQPNSDAALLNRVIGASSSQIFGNLNANGHIYIVNPNGINVGNSAKINANGVYLSTANISPSAFMSSLTPNPQSLIPGSANIVVSGNINAGSIAVLNGAKDIIVNGTISASAGGFGNGGKIIVLADNTADVSGAKLFARGGSVSGDGGFIETSGKNIYGLDSSVIDTGAANGKAGTWLIDPLDFTIVSGAGAQTTTTIGAATLVTSLGAQNVSIASAAGAGTGDILVTATVDYSAGTSNHDLTLSAYRHITITSGQQLKFGGTGTLTLRTDNTGTGTGTLIATSASAVTLGGSAVAKVYYNNANYAAPTAFNIAGGTSIGYMLINGTADFTRLYTGVGAAAALLSYNYALGKNINASGFAAASIGNGTNSFQGKFDGLNNTLTRLPSMSECLVL